MSPVFKHHLLSFARYTLQSYQSQYRQGNILVVVQINRNMVSSWVLNEGTPKELVLKLYISDRTRRPALPLIILHLNFTHLTDYG